MTDEPEARRLHGLGCAGAHLLHDRHRAERIVALRGPAHLDLRRRLVKIVIGEGLPLGTPRGEKALQAKRHVLPPPKRAATRTLVGSSYSPRFTAQPAKSPDPAPGARGQFPARGHPEGRS